MNKKYKYCLYQKCKGNLIRLQTRGWSKNWGKKQKAKQKQKQTEKNPSKTSRQTNKETYTIVFMSKY